MSTTLTPRRRSASTLSAAVVIAACAGAVLTPRAAMAQVQATPVMLEWFECSWANMEYRVPDFFVSGYSSVWVPPVSQASDPTSPGYDVFNRFDLGSPADKTLYGTEDGFRAVIDQFHRAYGQVFPDIIMNHNSGRTGSTSFYNDGGYPGFWLGPGPAPLSTSSNWGDFHNGSKESENPSGSNYDLWTGDLVGLIDIAQESNNQYVRQPVSFTPPVGTVNIPAGAVRNQPDPNNARFYPDKTLTPVAVNNPGMSRNACCGFPSSIVGAQAFTFYPFNTVTPLNGTPVADNTTGLLMRWTQWMLDDLKVDGFRLDASKHIPPWFWDLYWDAVVYQRRTAFDGVTKVTPFSFGENVMANDQTWAFYIRKNSLRAGDSFGNRDGLDINGSGAIRDLVNARGTGSWNNVLSNHLDNADDNDNNGSIGVNHIYSQDNGSSGTGSTLPALPAADKAAWPEFAYLLLRTGTPEVYHNARQFTNRTGGFWPREGSPEALGLDRAQNGTDPTLTNLVRLHNRYARGSWDVKVLDSDVVCFERHYNSQSNIVCCVDDSYSNGYDTRTFVTRYAQGTRLVELTGNAVDPTVDPNGDIYDTITVGAGGTITVRVPRNRAATGVEHNKGFVVYGQVTPPGTFSVASGLAQTVPPDPVGTTPARRRMTPIDVVQGSSFTIQLQTQNDPTEGALDDNAIYRFNQGAYSPNLGTNGTASGEPSGELHGHENFVTTKSPKIGGSGLYQQVINTSALPEGYNYLSVIAFRQRAANTSPIYSEWRDVIYVDRADPVMTMDTPVISCTTGGGTLSIHNTDRTASNVFVFIDLPVGNPLPPLDGSSAGLQWDRTNWLYSVSGLSNGTHTATIVAQEVIGSTLVRTARGTPISFSVTRLQGDFNGDGTVNTNDLGVLLSGFGLSVPPGSVPDINGDGLVNTIDLGIILTNFGHSCSN